MPAVVEVDREALREVDKEKETLATNKFKEGEQTHSQITQMSLLKVKARVTNCNPRQEEQLLPINLLKLKIRLTMAMARYRLKI